MNKQGRITFQLPQNVKTLIFEKYIGKRAVSGFIRNLVQRRFLECNVLICLECGSEPMTKEPRADCTRYYCKICNNQVAIYPSKNVKETTLQ